MGNRRGERRASEISYELLIQSNGRGFRNRRLRGIGGWIATWDRAYPAHQCLAQAGVDRLTAMR